VGAEFGGGGPGWIMGVPDDVTSGCTILADVEASSLELPATRFRADPVSVPEGMPAELSVMEGGAV